MISSVGGQVSRGPRSPSLHRYHRPRSAVEQPPPPGSCPRRPQDCCTPQARGSPRSTARRRAIRRCRELSLLLLLRLRSLCQQWAWCPRTTGLAWGARGRTSPPAGPCRKSSLPIRSSCRSGSATATRRRAGFPWVGPCSFTTFFKRLTNIFHSRSATIADHMISTTSVLSDSQTTTTLLTIRWPRALEWRPRRRPI